jgi:hypothetical protein
MCKEAVAVCLALSRAIDRENEVDHENLSPVYLPKFESSPSQIKVGITVLRAVTWAVHNTLETYAV